MRFSIDSPDSLENNLESGMPEVLRFCPSMPTILAGSNKDLPNYPHTLLQLAKAKQEGRQVDNDRLRPVSYSETAVILMRFSIDSPDSLENNPESGRPEALRFCPSMPTILAGSKKDLLNHPHTLLQLAKSKQEGRQVDYDWLRPVSYSETAVLLTRVSIDSPDSLENNLESGREDGEPAQQPHTLLELAMVN
ncbi:ras-like GTP-binding protein rhoA [Dermacentor silvarum]|uniref:ras-like GTP-binding protein rhoA n=1 Tax=Dermacentor silvarum TaxID=543639 RepID=UPI00210149FA|nr:ras-like GTP-binding protein rhoA [Dermacentor silvarum]